MTLGSFILAAAVLAAAAAPPKLPPVSSESCSAASEAPIRGRSYRAEAFANGRRCATAVVTIVLRRADGKVLWADALPADSLMTFAGVKNQTQMSLMLADWLRQQHMFKSSADLPEWKKGADAPEAGEFPFYPEAGVDRETYTQIRSEKQAMFCYVQGMESMACIAIAGDGAATKVGVQTFPG